jgi:PAS domain S-box-containing protein
LPWGAHFCQFYQNKQDLIDTLVPYFQGGLEGNEYCMWITSEPLGSSEAKAALAERVGNLDEYFSRNQIEILDYRDWYTEGGRFDSDRVRQAWIGRLESARARGFDGLRLCGNRSWIEKADWSGFNAHEAAVNGVIGDRRMIALCAYSLAKCGAAEILDVVSNHHFAVIRRSGEWQVIQNAERKRSEAGLRESEACESGGVGIWDNDHVSGRRTWSDLCKRHLGLPPDREPDAGTFLRAVHPDDRERVERIVQQALQPQSGGCFQAEYRTLSPEDGQERTIAATGRVYFDQDGRPARSLGAAVDITARKRTEEELLRHREWLGVTLTSIGDAVLATDIEGRITFLNPGAARLLGWSPDEALGRPVGDVIRIVEEQSGKWGSDIVREVLASGKARALANHSAIVVRDGRVVPVEDSAAPIRDAAGQVAGCVLVFHDVTARRRAQEELAESEAKYRGLFENMLKEVCFWSLVRDDRGDIVNWRLEDANPSALRALGKTLPEVRGRLAHEFFGAERVARRLPMVRRVVAEGAAAAFEEYFAEIDRHLRLSIIPVGDHLITTSTDITAIQKAREALQRTEARWNAAIENLEEGLVIATEAGQLIYWNPAARAMHGLWMSGEGMAPLEELAGTFQLWTPDGSRMLAMDEWPISRIIRGGETVRRVELLLRRPDQGWERIVSYSGARIATAGGEPLIYLSVYDLTEQRKAEEAAREVQRNFQQLVECLPQMVWTGRPDGPCDYLSPQWLRYTGRPEASQLGYGWLEEIHPDDRLRVATGWQAACGAGEHIDAEFRIRRHDGQYRWFRTLGVPLRDTAGHITRWFGTNTDIHDMKLAEQAVRQSRLDLDRAQAVGQIGSWRLDVRRNAFTCSAETTRILGIPEDVSLSYEAFLEIVHPEDRPYVDREAKAGLRGEPYDIEHRLLVDGRVKWVREKAYLEFDDAGALLGAFGITQDMTESKRAEERIRQQNTTLEAINRIFAESLAADSEEEVGRMCLAIAQQVTSSKFGFLAEFNPAGALDVIAMSEPGCRATLPDGSRTPLRSFDVAGIYGRVVVEEKGLFGNDLLSDPAALGVLGDHPPVTCFLGAPLKHDGKTIGLLGVANREGGYRPEDVECLEALSMAVGQVFLRKRAEGAARQAEEQFRHAQKMESIGLLAGGIAHDFNNLLTSILGNASLIEMVEGKKSAPIRTIMQSSEKAAALTRQLLAYAGKGRFERADFDVARLLRSCPDLIRVSIPKNVEVQLDVPRGLPAVRGDSTQIQQVVMNLIINAAEAIGGRADGKVSIRASVQTLDRAAAEIDGGLAPGRYVQLVVEDNGCGMAPDTVSRIFEPFFTTKFAGRGLGLAAVHGILATHKGAITVESRLGSGSTFTVYLPCRKVRAERTRKLDKVSDGRGVTVLVVDDEDDICEYTKAALGRFGYRVVTAANGREALDVLATRRDVRVIVLDVVMPVMGGVEALGEIHKQRPDVAIVVASGYSHQEAARLGIPGDMPFIAKPYTLKTLAAAVEAALRAAHPRA